VNEKEIADLRAVVKAEWARQDKMLSMVTCLANWKIRSWIATRETEDGVCVADVEVDQGEVTWSIVGVGELGIEPQHGSTYTFDEALCVVDSKLQEIGIYRAEHWAHHECDNGKLLFG